MIESAAIFTDKNRIYGKIAARDSILKDISKRKSNWKTHKKNYEYLYS